jgi:hypothetical protein
MLALVAHAYSPSYSGGRDQEDQSQARSQKTYHTKELVEWLKV